METNKRTFDVVKFDGMNFPVRFINVSEGEPHEGWEEMITQYTIVDENFAAILRSRKDISSDENILFFEDWIVLTVDEFATLTDEEIKGMIEKGEYDLQRNKQ